MLVVSTVVMLVEGFSRAAFSTSFFWAEELVRILMVAAFFVSLGATGRRGHHIRTDMLVAMVGPRARKAMDLFAALRRLASTAALLHNGNGFGVVAGMATVAGVQCHAHWRGAVAGVLPRCLGPGAAKPGPV
jgi:TRAP-type C4-dicarboxylate transport system permease small subunit